MQDAAALRLRRARRKQAAEISLQTFLQPLYRSGTALASVPYQPEDDSRGDAAYDQPSGQTGST